MPTIPQMQAKLETDIYEAVERALMECKDQTRAAYRLGVTKSWLTRYCQRHSDRLAQSTVFTGWKRDYMIRKHHESRAY